MRTTSGLTALGVCALMVASALAAAETKVELSGVHLCCGACVKGVAAAVKKVDGVQAKCDQEAGTVALTAADEGSAKKAISALADAGYFGTADKKDLAIPPDADTPKGKAAKVTVSGVHNCCRSCCVAIKEAVKTVKGVEADTAAPKSQTFEVTGDFDAEELAKALRAAGFNAKIRK